MKVGIVGANGYSGVELIRLLQQHPYVTIEKIVSHSTHGKNILELYPHLYGVNEMILEKWNLDELINLDLVFFATPSGVSKDIIPPLLDKGVTCIDLSGDFRLKNAGDYETWYKKTSAPAEYLQKATYGLSEVYRDKIKQAKLVANPGCFPTATLLGLLPALKKQIIHANTIHVDAKTGVSGAGRNANLTNLFTEINENIRAYKLGEHQHIPEIEQVISDISGEQVPITFITHLIPINRGIMCTMYADLVEQVTTEEVHQIYKDMYKDEMFIRIRPIGEWPTTKEVMGSNFCDIGVMVNRRTNKLIIISVIDNLVKGAAGQAMQNMNIINGWEEHIGLNNSPLYP